MHDKDFWRSIADNQYALPVGYSVDDLTAELLGYLDNPDSELRDEIAVETLTSWILGGYYTPETLRELIAKWTANLLQGLGEQGTYSVLLRSFSALMLSIVVFYDLKSSFLSVGEVHDLLERALYYCTSEQDVRGYEEEVGWLHSPAHTADLLKFLTRNPHTTPADHQRVLMAVAHKVTEPRPSVFVHSEYERLAWVVLDVLKRRTLPAPMWQAWIDELASVKRRDSGKQDSNYHGMYQNTKHFLRAVYFILAYLEEPLEGAEEVKTQVFEALKLFKI